MNQALPKAIQAQLDQAAEIERQLAAPVEGNTDPVVTEDPKPAEQLPVENATQATVTTTVPDETWEQRFNVLRGKYDAEIPRLHQQLREYSEQLTVLTEKLSQKPQEPEQPKQDRVTDKDREEFGADLLDAAARAAEDVFDRREASLLTKIEKMISAVAGQVQTVEERQVVTEADRFWSAVRAVHADFNAVYSDQRWFDYLDQRVPGTRFTRRATAEDAIKRFDAEVLIEMVTAFKDTLPKKPTEPSKPTTELQSQVSPSTSQASSAPSADTGRIWTGAEYAAAMDHRNLQRMTKDQYEAMVAEAELAAAEGRVKW